MKASAIRLLAGCVVVGLAALGLWQAGILFQDTKTGGDNQPVLAAAHTGIDTPGSDERTVGLNEGDLAPDFEFSAFDGRRLRLSDFRGQAVFLNFWATWCAPCRTEMPLMEALLEAYSDQGLVILAVNNGDGYGPAQRFIDEIGVKFSAFGYDRESNVARRYSIYGMPTSFFIDANGVITGVSQGQFPTYESMEAAALKALAADASVAP